MRSALCFSVLSAMGWAGASEPRRQASVRHRSIGSVSTSTCNSPFLSGRWLSAKRSSRTKSGRRTPADRRSRRRERLKEELSCMVRPESVRWKSPSGWTGNSPPSGVTLRYEVDAEKLPAPSAVLKQDLLTVSLAGYAESLFTLTLSRNAIP